MTATLIEEHDVLLFDLDGVVYAGSTPVAGAPEMIERLGRRGVRVAYVTNNASRPPEAIAAKLTGMEIPAEPEQIVTSAQAAARLLSERLPSGARVLVVGGEGLIEAAKARGLVPVSETSEEPVAVVQGFHPTVGWQQLAEGAYALQQGLPWVATNVDRTLPTDRGLAPGNGTLVEVLKIATGREPIVAGKPERPLFDEAVARTAARRPLVVGDRLDTDIAGANRAGIPSLLVLTGVSRIRDLLLAPPVERPTYVSFDLAGLFTAHPVPVVVEGVARCGGWSATIRDAALVLQGEGDRDDAVRALAAAAWSHAEPTALDLTAVPLAGE